MEFNILEEQIRGKLNKFPSKTRRVAEYLLANPSEAAFQSISETADKLEVSRAQLVRVSRMLGFDGYADLKSALKQKLLKQINPTSDIDIEYSDETPEDLAKLEQANIQQTAQNFILNRNGVHNFCKAVKDSDVIYCMGWGISAMPAEWLYTRFAELGLKSVLMRRGSLSLLEQSRGISENDMLIVCELPSYVIEITEAVKQISARTKCKIAVITDSPAAPVCSFAQMQFFVSDRSPLFGSSLIGSMFTVQTLTTILARKMGKEAEKALAAQRENLTDERVYFPAYRLRY